MGLPPSLLRRLKQADYTGVAVNLLVGLFLLAGLVAAVQGMPKELQTSLSSAAKPDGFVGPPAPEPTTHRVTDDRSGTHELRRHHDDDDEHEHRGHK